MAFMVIRCFILYCAVIVAVRIMGKRQIGELQPSELVITILISELASMPIQDTEQPLLSGILPIFTLAAIEVLVSIIALKSIKTRYLFYGKPIIMIYKGVIFQKEMEKARVSLDDIVEAMRSNGVASIEDVNFAILETNGNISIIPKESGEMAELIIIDGRVIKENIAKKGLSDNWLKNILKAQQVKSAKEIFLLTLDSAGKTYIVKKEKLR